MDAFDLAAGVIEGRDGLAAAMALLASKKDIVRAAYAAGFSKTEIHQLTGMARSTITIIIDQDPS